MTTLRPIDVPTLSSTSRLALSHEIEQCPPAVLRLILKNLCDESAHVAEALHRALCIDKRPLLPPTSVAVVDLTEATDSDKENATASSSKRKAPEEFIAVAKKIKTVATIATGISWKDRYVHCVNCYELFDVIENEQEKNSALLQSPSTSGPRGAVEEDHDESSSECSSSSSSRHGNCVFHDGYLQADHDSDFWDDHDENIHGVIDSMELRKEYPEAYTWDCCDKDGTADGCRTEWHQAGSILEYFAELQKANGVN